MNKVQVVIEVGEKTYEDIMYDYEHKPQNLTFLDKVIVNGTPLPKGHGRLIDENQLIKEIRDDIVGNFDNLEYWLSAADTIVEADKAESEE